MAGQIKIVPDALRSAAEQVRSIATMTVGAVDSGSGIAVALFDVWEGKGSEAAISQLEDLRVGGTKIVENVNESASVLEHVASAFEAADRGESAPITIWAANVPALHQAMQTVGCIPGHGFANFQSWIHGGGAVRIIPAQVRELAAQCRNIANVYEEASHSLRSVVNSLAGDWEGNAYNRFSESCNEIMVAYSGIQSAVITISEALIQAANRYEELDNTL